MAGIFHYGAEHRIVHMTDLREQVVLYLVIQSTYKPRDHFVIPRKISCGLDLVNGPFVLDGFRIMTGLFKLGMLYHVRQLKYNCQYKALYNVQGCKSDCPCLPADSHYRYGDIKYNIQHLAKPEHEMLCC